MSKYKVNVKIDEQNQFWIVVDNQILIKNPTNEDLKDAKIKYYTKTNICPLCKIEKTITNKSILYPTNAVRGKKTLEWVCIRHTNQIIAFKRKIRIKIDDQNQFWIVLYENKLIMSPTEDDLKWSKILYYNPTNICPKCREENNITIDSMLYPNNTMHDTDINGRKTDEWVCNKHGLRSYQRYDNNSLNNMKKPMTAYRTGHLYPNSNIAKGDNFEELTEKWLGAEKLSIKYDIHGLSLDHDYITKHIIVKIEDKLINLYEKIPQTKGCFYDSIYRRWSSMIKNEHNKEFDYLIFYCTDEDGKTIKRIYIFPKEETDERTGIGIYNKPTDSWGNSIVPWHEKYRITDEETLKLVNKIWKEIIGEKQ